MLSDIAIAMEIHTVITALGSMIAVLVAVIGSLLLVVVLYISHERRKYSHLPSPPYDSFFFGHIPELRRFKLEGNYVGDLFRKWAEECGPVFVLYIAHRQRVFITGAASLKELLTKSKYPKSKAVYVPLYSVFGCRFLGNGLLSQTDHSAWRRRHVVVNPAFHKRYLMGFMEQFNSVGDRWVKSLEAVADGKTTIKMLEYMFRVTSDAISEVGFQDHRNLIESKDDRFLDAIKYCLEALSITSRDPLSDYRPSQSKFRQTVRDSVNLVRTYGQNVLNARIEQMKHGQPEPKDILSHIIKCKDVDPTLTDVDLLDDFMTLFIAGQETTSNALSFMFCEVGKRPDVLQKLQDEIDAVMGSRTDIEYEDISKLEYCGQVFKEVLRLYPVAPGTSRETSEEVILDGYRLPPGACFAMPFYVVHRMHSYYDNPDEFCPERFTKSKERTLFTYMPFSLGQRACIGQQFAKIEAKVLMCKFFQNFDFKLDMNQSFKIEEVASLRPKGGAIMTVSRRNK